jgi:Fe-S-cluster containining protein
MVDPGKEAPPQVWLAEYFRTRSQLASCELDFHCPPACARPGCKQPNLQIPISLVDLLGAAGQQNEPVSVLYRQNYGLGLLAVEQHDWLRRVSLKLHKPCPFLKQDLCSIYPVRPLPCILFPEYLVHEGRFESEAQQEHFRDFLCMQGAIVLSPARTRVMARLKNLWERETLVSSYYLFNLSHFYLDFSNVVAELILEDRTLRTADSAVLPEPPGTIPNRVLEHFFQERLAGSQIFAELNDKIDRLDSPEGQAHFLQLLQDDRLVQKLRRSADDRALIFRFVKGKLQGKRRSLTPREYKFY